MHGTTVARVERVLIVGGGIGGLSLAIALRQRGLSADIVERADAGAASGAGLYLYD
ncbi:MAG: FAD-dependent oxidoreductase [Woeseia sp.]